MISDLFSSFSTVQVCILTRRNQIDVMIKIPGVDDEDVNTEVISFQRCFGLLSGQRAVKLEGIEGTDRVCFLMVGLHRCGHMQLKVPFRHSQS